MSTYLIVTLALIAWFWGFFIGRLVERARMHAKYTCTPEYVEYLKKENKQLLLSSLEYFNWAKDEIEKSKEEGS